VGNVDTNRELWDKYARRWHRNTVPLDSGTGERTVPKDHEESYREAHINVLGDEWASPTEVEQVVVEYIYPYINAESVVGEIGVGGGRIASRVAGRARRFIAFDVSSEMLTKAQAALADHSNIEYVLLDEPVFGERLHGAFDFVYSFDVFVHVDLHVMWKYFRAIGAILRPGGRAFVHTANLTAPGGWARFERQPAYSVQGHYFVSPDIVHTLAERGGFKIVKTSTPDPSNVYLNRDYLVVMEK
jgi:SAM-dependent methyltransferase